MHKILLISETCKNKNVIIKEMIKHQYNYISAEFLINVLKIARKTTPETPIIKKDDILEMYQSLIKTTYLYANSKHRKLKQIIEYPEIIKEEIMYFTRYEHIQQIDQNTSLPKTKNNTKEIKNKSILLCGASRSGKTTLGLKLSQYGYNLILIDTFIIITVYSKQNEETKIKEILKQLTNYYAKYANQYYQKFHQPIVYDDPYSSPEEITKYISKIDAYFLGYPNVKVKSAVKNYQQFDQDKSDWTFLKDDIELTNIAQNAITKSQELQKKCEKLKLIFIDTKEGKEREETIKNIYQTIINSEGNNKY